MMPNPNPTPFSTLDTATPTESSQNSSCITLAPSSLLSFQHKDETVPAATLSLVEILQQGPDDDYRPIVREVPPSYLSRLKNLFSREKLRSHKSLLHVGTPLPSPIASLSQSSPEALNAYSDIVEFVQRGVTGMQVFLAATLTFFLLVISSAISLTIGHLILRSAQNPAFAAPVWPSSFEAGAVGGAVLWLPLVLFAIYTGAIQTVVLVPIFAAIAGITGTAVLQHSMQPSLGLIQALGAEALGSTVAGIGLVILGAPLYCLLKR